MNLASLDARNTEARRRITTAASALANALDLPPLAEPTAIEWRQPAVGQMRELECVADLLEGIAAALLEETAHAESKGRS